MRTRVVRPKLKGRPFGRWLVLSMQTEEDPPHRTLARCKCVCGTVRLVRAAVLLAGDSKSCGCASRGPNGASAAVGRANKGQKRPRQATAITEVRSL